MKEHFNKKTDTRSNTKIQRIHADISGIRPISFRGYRYFMLYIDDDTRTCWVYLMKTKTSQESINVFKQFKAMVENETGNKIQYFRADNGKGEFGAAFQDELKSAGIQLEASPPYKHSMNGVVERAMQTINKLARSLIYQAKLPVEMWDYAIEHAGFLKNRHPTAALPNVSLEKGRHREPMTPYEAYTGKMPDCTNIRAFGTAAFLIYPKEKHPPAFQPRFQDKYNYIHVGMEGSSIYRLLNIETLKEERYADIRIDEYVYPAAQELVTTSHQPESATTDKMDQPMEHQVLSTNERATHPITQPLGQSAAAPRAESPMLDWIEENPELHGRRSEQPPALDNLDGQNENFEKKTAQPACDGHLL